MSNYLKLLSFLFLATLLLLSSCDDDDDPDSVNPEEEITTLILEFTIPGATTPTVTATWRDLDGDGGQDPVIDDITLSADTTYQLQITLLNENEEVNLLDKEYNVTIEVLDEADEHQFFFDPSSNLNLQIDYADEDENGDPIGQNNGAATGNPSTGTLDVVLRHELDKDATGVSDGDITNAGGDTDISVTFDVSIEN